MTMTTDLTDLHQVIDQLPESVLPKLTRFIRALVAESRHNQDAVESSLEVNQPDISPFEVGKTYQIATPYGSYDATRILMEHFEKEELKGWLKLSEASYVFWENEKDDFYDSI